MVNYEMKPILIVYDEKTNALLWELSNAKIVQVLRQGPMTLREIASEYNEHAKNNESLDQKSETTIYRYVKALEEAGLVTQAGRRVYMGKTTTEILYARTARVFQNKALPLAYWNSSRGRTLFKRIYSAIEKIYPDHKPMKKCLSDYIYSFEEAQEKEVEKILQSLDDDVIELITAGDWWEIEQVVKFIGIFGLVLNQPSMFDNLEKCFKEVP
jgi:DNA-binding transcriptional ArsR family regulator